MIEATLPTRLMVATDMSAQSDRALARAWQLAKGWNCPLDAVHAVSAAEAARRDRPFGTLPSWRRSEPWTSILERRLRDDLHAAEVVASPRVIVGPPAETVLDALSDTAASLVVLGCSRKAGMDRIQLGSTVDRVVRHAPVPVLNVRSRVRGPYRHVVVASDFSEPAARALTLAARWFQGARLTLFHAYVPPGASVADDAAVNAAWRATVVRECEAHLASVRLPSTASLECLLERGGPGELLADFVAHTDVDLLVVGSHARGGLARALLGSVAEYLLHSVDGDVLVVRGP